MLPLPSENGKVSPFFVFYLIVAAQFGLGVFSFQREIVKVVGNDAWIAVFIAGISIHVVLWMIYQILNKGTNDITVIHKELFGKWLGGMLSLALIVYLLTLAISVVRSYTELIQVWIFPQLETWYMALILSMLVYVYVIGGFRIIVGICFLSFIFTTPIFFIMLGFPLRHMQISHLFPIFDHSAAELLSASKTMTYSLTGFETIFFFYTFIKDAPRSQKWGHYGTAFSTISYLVIMIVSLMYFSKNQLLESIWPTLTIWQIADFPFLERFEFLGLSFWLFSVVNSVCLYIWAGTRGLKQLFSLKQKHSLIAILFMTAVAATFLKTREQIDQLNSVMGLVSLYVMYAYIPFIFFYQVIKGKSRRTS
ncbi:GerAB/ArcD/ProY family transporter [Bacillus sp. mrc49]|uniref:GerAB/ArcD/ProY family transporter n=1 Tax=Bacillus sp. mrc49 TaxID=2054913 RepID=UPI000C270E67|nr:GerAB/ArcD/ProY family transporter [Bacillus sp. mrc49]PJN88575.1 spore gernimation protein GerB [Bacillus sp. mrc49]